MQSKKATSIPEYIKAAPKEAQPKLRQMQATIKKASPGAVQGIKWSMPAFSKERILVMFAAFKTHVGFFPTPRAIVAFKKDLEKYKTGKGSIQFPLDKPLPLSLITKITRFRVAEENKKWKT